MASIQQLTAAAAKAGFVRTECAHLDSPHHLVFDYPEPLSEDRMRPPFFRVHTDTARVPHATYIHGGGSDDDVPVEQRTTLVHAITWMAEIARQYPKEG
jgi:hypothetical protein